MNDILFDSVFFLMEFVSESGNLTGANFDINNLVVRIPIKEIIRIS